MGAEISDSFPLAVSGRLNSGEFTMRGDVSSQFVTGLLMALSYLGGGKINLLPPVQSRPYIDITLQVLKRFGADIKEENNIFYIVVKDNGKGFSLEQVIGQKDRHFGISVMKERVYLLNGDISIETEPGRGTEIKIEIPLV